MSKVSHTPGPWVAIETRVYFPKHAGGFDIRNCPNPEANARLIAAAPELLEVLHELYVALEIDGCAQPFQMQKARAAIAKATGEQA